eukprot:TRINITY_DN68092_c0_g1_i1.p1 TRINITY_DN68092_c0_g1~~TRINITY_DN68092_c0_g1_i1.p1  ORF type:complete len:305 (+),score=68.00 TRINITY_DN68092_c0_g1_i1:130-915(+)
MADAVKLEDGSVMQVARLPEVDESTWGDMKAYLENNPAIAKGLQNFSKNPIAMKGWLQTQAIADHYQKKIEGGDATVKDRLEALESDEEVGHIFQEIRKNGLSAAMKYWDNEALLLKIDEKMGGLPSQLQPTMQKISETPLSLQQAAAKGDLKSVEDYLSKTSDINAHDSRGITALAHAVGKNQVAAVKLLIENKANLESVDAKGNSALHYAAGYGHAELVEYFIKAGAPLGQANAQGQTAVSLALLNKHQKCLEILEPFQ